MGSSSALIYRSWAWIKQMSPIVPIDSLNIRREDETGDVMSTIRRGIKPPKGWSNSSCLYV